MPEGHSVHRIARQFGANFVGQRVRASSPQGRFADGAARLNGHVMVDAFAVTQSQGKLADEKTENTEGAGRNPVFSAYKSDEE